MHCGPVLGRVGSFWVVSDSFHRGFHIVFSAVSGRLWVVRIELNSIGGDPCRDNPGRRSFAVVFA